MRTFKASPLERKLKRHETCISWSSTARLLRDIISDTWESYKCVNWVFSSLPPASTASSWFQAWEHPKPQQICKTKRRNLIARSPRYWHWILSGSIFGNVLFARNWYVRFYCGKHLWRDFSLLDIGFSRQFARCALYAWQKSSRFVSLCIWLIIMFRGNFGSFDSTVKP